MGVEIVGGIIVSPRNFLRTVRVALKNGVLQGVYCRPFFSALAPNIVQPLVSDSDTPLTRRHVVVDVQQSPFPPMLLVLKGRMCYVRVSPTALPTGKSATGRRGDAPRAGVGRADRRPSNGL